MSRRMRQRIARRRTRKRLLSFRIVRARDGDVFWSTGVQADLVALMRASWRFAGDGTFYPSPPEP